MRKTRFPENRKTGFSVLVGRTQTPNAPPAQLRDFFEIASEKRKRIKKKYHGLPPFFSFDKDNYTIFLPT